MLYILSDLIKIKTPMIKTRFRKLLIRRSEFLLEGGTSVYTLFYGFQSIENMNQTNKKMNK